MEFEKVKKEHVLQGIKDFEEKGYPNGFGPSSTYDIVYKGKNYAPKTIIVYANFHANGRTIEPYFKGGIGTDCFKSLEREGFVIIAKKDQEKSIVDIVQDFIVQVHKGGLKTSSYPKIYNKLKLKVSFGQGVAARIPWIGIYKDPNTISKGIYPSFLYYKEYSKLVLAYGMSETEQVEYNWGDTNQLQTIEEWHIKEFKKKPDRYGSSFIKGVYDIKTGLDKNKLKLDLEELIAVYEKIDFISKPNYWVFQGNPKIYDTVGAIEANVLETWSVHAHKTKIKISDKIILWITGENSGCYALAEVTSELFHSPEISNEKKYYAKDPGDQVTSDKVKIKITHDLTKNPILKPDMNLYPVFDNFKGGNQGTNFSATETEYNALLNWKKMKDVKYWLYAPGRNAEHWNEFYSQNIMAIGWDKIGDLSQYEKKDNVVDALREVYGGEGSKKNNATANFEFVNTMQIGDVVIVKQGRTKLLGYGIVTSDYFFDDKRDSYRSCRRVDWKEKGSWDSDHSLVLKTLTDITKYKSEHTQNEFYYQDIMNLMKGEKVKTISSKKKVSPLNQILYGPPGTGKTYYLKNQLFSQYTSQQTAISKENHFDTIVSDCSWWQVIAIALLDLKKAKVTTIFENEWIQKKISLSNANSIRPILWSQLQSHTINECEFVNVSSRQQPLLFNKTKDSYWEILEEEVKELAPELYNLKDSVDNYNPDSDKEIKNYEFVTFHQSYSYEDFIEGIKPIINADESKEESNIGYRIEDGVFKKLCLKAAKNPTERYAIFIDEINRGNVSAIFGELITLIEQDKRQGQTNEIGVMLPYSKSHFTVPSNIDIYGTMNTADRSVEALDTALRRRFSFLEMMPNIELLSENKALNISLKDILRTINNRIEILIDRDHTIGHSYFMGVKTATDLTAAFKDKIVPLLQEYFYGDYGKIGLVLGDGFVKSHKKSEKPFANFKYEGKEELNRDFYDLVTIDKDFDIKKSIEKLLNTPKDN